MPKRRTLLIRYASFYPFRWTYIKRLEMHVGRDTDDLPWFLMKGR